MIEAILEQIGLTQNEIKVYLALLELGQSKSGAILKQSGLNSGKIYEILDALQKKGLVSSIIQSGVLHFSPANPKRLLDYLGEKKQNIERQESAYKSILPGLLQKISFARKKSAIEIFTGLKGMKTAYAKELEYSKSDTLFVIGVASSKLYSKAVWDFFVNSQQPNREQIGYNIRKLLDKNAKDERRFHEKKAKIKYLSYGSAVSINVIGNLCTIGIFTHEPLFISIENKEIADNFKEQFELLWTLAEKS